MLPKTTSKTVGKAVQEALDEFKVNILQDNMPQTVWTTHDTHKRK